VWDAAVRYGTVPTSICPARTVATEYLAFTEHRHSIRSGVRSRTLRVHFKQGVLSHYVSQIPAIHT
jgi:hypothetical protein